MPDIKISALTDGLTVEAGDRLPVARSPYGSTDNRYITRAYLKAYLDTLYEAINTVSTHVAAGDPHVQYALESALGSLALVSNLTGVVTSVGAATSIAAGALSIAKTSGLQTALDGKQPLDADLTAISALISAADKIAYATGAGTWALADFTAAARTLLAAVSASAQRTALGLAIGVDVQAYDAELAAIAGLISAADKLPYFTGLGSASLADLTAAGRALIAGASAAAQRTTLGLVIGTDVQAQDAELAAIAGLASVADRLPYFTGTGTAALATFTAVARTLLAASTVQAQRAVLEAHNIILFPSNPTAGTLGPLTNYYWGAFALSTNPLLNSIYVRRACSIKAIRLGLTILGTLSSGETGSAFVRVNDTTDTLISSALVFNTATLTRYDNTALDIALAAGDFFCVKLSTPNFTPNPTSVVGIISAETE